MFNLWLIAMKATLCDVKEINILISSAKTRGITIEQEPNCLFFDIFPCEGLIMSRQVDNEKKRFDDNRISDQTTGWDELGQVRSEKKVHNQYNSKILFTM
jgi:hypothetical protein